MGAPQLGQRALESLTSRGRALAGARRRQPFPVNTRVDLNEQLTTLLRSGPSLSALAEATATWVRHEVAVDAVWFEPAGQSAVLEAARNEPDAWAVTIDDGVLTGVAIACRGELVGSLLAWHHDSRARTAILTAFDTASIWLGSALEVRAFNAQPGAVTRSKQAAAGLHELEDRFATVSHELRTPLSTVVGGLELLIEGDLGELTAQQRKMLERMRTNCERMAELVDNATLVPLNTLQAQQRAIGQQPVDAAEILREAAQAVPEDLGIEVRVEAPDSPMWTTVAQGDLRLMIGRVLDNALKFSPRDSLVVLSAWSEDDRVCLSVSDRGRGLSPDELAHIGRPFYRGIQSRRDETPGAGLGLSMARTLAHTWDGSLGFESAEGVGTRATFRLPQWPAEIESDAAGHHGVHEGSNL